MLQNKYDSLDPGPNAVKKFATAPLAAIGALMAAKKQYEDSWKKQEELDHYLTSKSLYSGHLRFQSGNDYFFMESPTLKTRSLGTSSGNAVYLVNVDDYNWHSTVRLWHEPKKHADVVYSRSFDMHNWIVSNVNIRFDRSSSIASAITDSYLRKALLRNKSKEGIQSIIRSIQTEQDEIRTLPVKHSFIVQGIAGSGKTMVLLHRLRYLLYNQSIDPYNFLFLVPSNRFKSFISDFCQQFRIPLRNIMPVQAYYQMMMGKPPRVDVQDVDELVFDSKYLARVYSAEFMKKCYRRLFDLLSSQINDLTDICDTCLSRIAEDAAKQLEENITRTRSDAVAAIRSAAEHVLPFIEVPLDTFSDIPLFLSALKQAYETAIEQREIHVQPRQDFDISPDDDRLQQHTTLVPMRDAIGVEAAKVQKASIFTINAHRKKLALLETQYQQAFEEIKQSLIEQDMQAYAAQSEKYRYVFEGVTIEKTENILAQSQGIATHAVALLEQYEQKHQTLETDLGQTLQEEISQLNDMIAFSAELDKYSANPLNGLFPALNYFRKQVDKAKALLSLFYHHMTPEETENTQSKLHLFTQQSDVRLQAYLNTLLFNECKRTIKQEFDIKICDRYKHYWYLALYCQYLTRDPSETHFPIIFIDEAQDLSPSELQLIYQLNTHTTASEGISSLHYPKMNVFGDVNQMITEHGVRTWDEVKFIKDRFDLNENFRNTNQIVDFCNQQLPIVMQSVGVDMEPVQQHDSLHEALQINPQVLIGSALIVKDEYARTDLTHLLRAKGITDADVYTIKAVKGLEFRSVVVFDRNMTANEKYIAYTRALARLTVVRDLPRVADADAPLFIEGDDPDEAE